MPAKHSTGTAGIPEAQIGNVAEATGAALPEETRTIGDACSVLARARHLNELMFMAGESIPDMAMKNGITTGADIIDELLLDVRAILYAAIDRKAGEA